MERDIVDKYKELAQFLLESAMRHADILQTMQFDAFKVSVKASDVFLAVEAYRMLSEQTINPCILVLLKRQEAVGRINHCLGMSLAEGIGDTPWGVIGR